MKQLVVFIRKEFKHVFRDRKSLLLLFGMPIAQIVLFGFALTNEIKNSKIAIVDYARNEASALMIDKINANTYFDVYQIVKNPKIADELFRKDIIKGTIVIPNDFGDNLLKQKNSQIQIITDATDPNEATAISNYLQNSIQDYLMSTSKNAENAIQIIPEVRMLYNPELKGAYNFVPGVIALVLMLVCTMMSSVSIVKEKEMGTMEILLVSPFKPIYIIISKLMPYLIISILNLLLILILSVTMLGLEIKGSILLLVFASTLFILTSLAIGLLISTSAKSQQAAMMTSLLGMMLPTLLLTGFMFPIENMPIGLQLLSNIVPSRWYFIIIKDVMLKGLGFFSVWKEMSILVFMTIVLLALSIKKFKIRLQE
ncbi:MAG: ABC transporter permease [Chitinophagaceae bacterium]